MDVGTVVKEVDGGYMSDNLIFFHKEYIENYPEFWELIKEPAFETEDNIKIHSDRKLYGVCLSDNIGYKAFELAEHNYKYNSHVNQSGFKWFAFIDNAISYIDLNKPIYSKQDLLNAAIHMQYGEWFINSLIKRINK